MKKSQELLRRHLKLFGVYLVWTGNAVYVDYGENNRPRDLVGKAKGIRTATDIFHNVTNQMHRVASGDMGI
jgi:hypothetical protein